MEKMTYNELIDALSHWEEIEFLYEWLTYWFINWKSKKDWVTYWFFLCNEINLAEEIGLFKEFDKLINFPNHYKIWNKTIKQIFEEWLNY